MPGWEADALLSYATGKPKEFLLTYPDHKLNPIQLARFFYARFQFNRGVPLAYITCHKEFFGLDFFVDKRVLTPRPETELMVEEAIKITNNESGIKNQEAILIDIGTGSGCVPIAIAKNINREIKIFASDISKKALQIAKKNASSHQVKIDFRKGNLLEPFLTGELHDPILITANLPYLSSDWKKQNTVDEKRLKFEPKIALYAEEKGLDLYRKLLKQLKSLGLRFTAMLEFDPRQTSLLVTLIKNILPKASIEIKKDLAGRDRLAIIKL